MYTQVTGQRPPVQEALPGIPDAANTRSGLCRVLHLGVLPGGHSQGLKRTPGQLGRLSWPELLPDNFGTFGPALHVESQDEKPLRHYRHSAQVIKHFDTVNCHIF